VSALTPAAAVPQVAGTPPTRELGITNPYPLPSWAQFGSTHGGPFVDYQEYVPELRWPTSVRTTYPRMRNDTQLRALMQGTVLPISRYLWSIDPNGADGSLVEAIAADLNLPVKGAQQAYVLRSQNRFSFKKHLLTALRALEYGHYYFEQVGEITAKSKGGDGLWHLRKLAARPPRTIGQIFVAQDGGLTEIKQYVGFWAPAIPVGNLVAYVWDQEPGNWAGVSMYRACYREWLIKDRLLRVDAINHEKAGGQWWAEAPPNALQHEINALGLQVSQIRAGEESGMAVPNGAKLHVERAGRGESAIDSINRHDEAMARAFLMMLIQLGSTQTGSRALGDSFTDFAGIFRESIASFFADVFNEHVIEDYVDWNYGEQVELVPRLVFDTAAAANSDASVDQFAQVTFDPPTAAAMRGAPRWRVEQLHAAYAREQSVYTRRVDRLIPALIEATAEEVRDEDGKVIATREQVIEAQLAELEDHAARDEDVHERLLEAITRPNPPKALAADTSLPARTLRRQPYPHEVRAATDFAAVDRQWQAKVDQLVNAWKQVRDRQISDLVGQIASAETGDLGALARVSTDAAGADVIASHLREMAHAGAVEAMAEARRQGVTAEMPSLDALERQITSRASALEQLLASSLSQTAASKAVQVAGTQVTGEALAATVGDHLNGLSDAWLADQLGGALSAAQNQGRVAAMRENGATHYYASELLDQNTCDPCVDVDGTEYANADDAAAAYPAGGYIDCDGGPRCRGTIVAVYDEASSSEGDTA
jgi:hypothetical protein